MSGFEALISTANAILWHDYVLFALLLTGMTFTIWSRFCQYRALTHGLHVIPGLGQWLVTVAVWLFALSTMISYSYYAEQGVVYLAGERAVTAFKLLYCLLPLIATSGFLRTDAQLDNLSGLGTALMLWVNIPLLWFLGHEAMAAYGDYIHRFRSGEMKPRRGAESLARPMGNNGENRP